MEAVESAMGLGIVLKVKDMASEQFGRIRDKMVETKGAAKDLVKTFDAEMKRMAMGLGMVAVGAGALAATFVAPMSMAMQAQYKMAEVNTLVGKGQEALMSKLGDQANALSVKFGKSGADITSAMYGLISAGVEAEKVGSVMDTVGKLAVGGVTDFATAGDGLTSLMNAFGVAAENTGAIADSMFVAMKRGKTTIGELSNSLGQVAPMAAKAGMSIDDMLGSIATATLSGLGTSESATGLRATLQAIMQPSEQAKKMAASLGIQFDEQALKAKGLRGTLEDVMRATGGNADQMGALLGSVEAFSFASNIMKNDGSIWSSIMDDMAKKSGAADEAFSIVADTWLHKWNMIKQAFTVGVKRFGAVFLPILGVIFKPLMLLASGFASLPKPILAVIGAVVAFGAAMLISRGTVLAFSAAMRLWSAGAGTQFMASLARSKRAMFGFNAQIIRSSLLMGGAGLAAYGLYKAYERNFGGIKTAVSWISAAWDVAMSATEDGTAKIKKSVLRGLGFENLEEGAQVISRIAAGFFRLRVFAEEFCGAFKRDFRTVAGLLDELGNKILGLGGSAFTDMLKSLLNIDKSDLQSWKDWGRGIGEVISFLFIIGGTAWIVAKAIGAVMMVVHVLATAFSIAGAAIGLFLSPVGAATIAGLILYACWEDLWEFLVTFWELPMAAVLGFIVGPIGWLIGLVVAIIANWDTLKAWFITLWNDPAAAVDQFCQYLQSQFNAAVDWAKGKWQGLKEMLSHPIDAAINFVRGGNDTPVDGIPGHAAGGVFNTPHLSWVCEDGPEAILPLDGSDRAASLWAQAGQMMGLMPSAPEPAAASVDGAPRPTMLQTLTERFTSVRETNTVEKASSGSAQPTLIENVVYLDGEQVYRSVKRHDRYDRLREGDDSAD